MCHCLVQSHMLIAYGSMTYAPILFVVCGLNFVLACAACKIAGTCVTSEFAAT